MDALTLLKSPQSRFQSGVVRGKQATGVDPDGGDDGFGVIYGASMIVEGEALGHNMWIDGEMLSSVAAQINEAGQLGIKARFKHPDMCGDAIGTGLGRIKNATEHENGSVTGDLHFSEASTKTPDGNLAEYLISLATNEPDHFGFSISFTRDADAEESFIEENEEDYTYNSYNGEEKKGKRFKSPAEANNKNLRHVRLKKLHASDAVDSPAANPNGLYYKSKPNHIADLAKEGLSYLLGLTSDAPKEAAFGVDPDRARGFFASFLEAHNLSIVSNDVDTPPKSNGDEADSNMPKESFSQEQLEQLEKHFAGVVPQPEPTKPAEVTREAALAALGLTEEQFKAAADAKLAADEAEKDAELNKKIEEKVKLMGLSAQPTPPATEDGGAPKEEAKDDGPTSWAEAVEADKALAEGLSFESGWKSGEVTLSSMPDNQDAFTLLRRAEDQHGKESAFTQEA